MTRPISRRKALAGAGVAALSAGCIGRARNIAGRDRPSQLGLEILTTPADEDPNGVRIARQLAENAAAVGIDARINTMGQMDLRRRVLLNHDFDVYVGQYLEAEPFDPDALYAFTHSRFTAETGWQNPFGFTEFSVDELLAEQRTATDGRRRRVVSELQSVLCELQPFTVVAFPDALTAIRDGEFEGWENSRPLSVNGLLGLEYREPTDDETETTLELVTTDQRITENWNPIAPEYRQHGTFSSLLYDQLVRMIDGEPVPWLAESVEWIDGGTIDITLRDARWHDGEPVRADDVAFTYDLLHDTSMGNLETPVPTPKFRGRSSLVESATARGDRTVRIEMETVNRRVGTRALEVPILPEHVWRERTAVATIAGFEFDGETTEAVVSNNADPVGSGPIELVSATPEESVTFARNPDHFLARAGQDDGRVSGGGETNGDRVDGEETTDDDGTMDSDGAMDGDDTMDEDDTTDGETMEEDDTGEDDRTAAGIPERFHGKPAFDRLVVEVQPSDIAAVQAVGDGRADATVSNLGPDSVPRIGREADARLVSTRSAAFYHVGYNVRRAPLSNPRFRGILSSFIDKAAIVDDAFEGYARPAASPLAASPEWVPEELRWDDDDRDPIHPFLGEDGDVDVEAAREALREAGYRFNDDGELLSRGQ